MEAAVHQKDPSSIHPSIHAGPLAGDDARLAQTRAETQSSSPHGRSIAAKLV